MPETSMDTRFTKVSVIIKSGEGDFSDPGNQVKWLFYSHET